MSRVRFTTTIGLVAKDDPFRFVEPIAQPGDEAELLEESEYPFSVPDGWTLVRVERAYEHPIFGPLDELFAPVHPSMIEPVQS